jgi:RimJ/RimL family protein N-acetyltransferase
MGIEAVWPLFALSLRTPRLELRVSRDEDLPGLAEAAIAGIHDPGLMPFGVPWTDAEPAELRRSLARYQWQQRAETSPGSWSLSFAVLRDGKTIGVQDLEAREFETTRTVATGSWLTRAAQGQGLGVEMRAAVLLFAFDHLGAVAAESSAATWNAASIAVSHRLGYEGAGVTRVEPRPGRPRDELRMRLRPERFVRPSWKLESSGVESAVDELVAH